MIDNDIKEKDRISVKQFEEEAKRSVLLSSDDTGKVVELE